MAFSIRVELTPTPLPSPGVAVAGCLVALDQMGAAGTAATPTSPQPATLTFSGIFLERARDPQNPVERQLGLLSGTLSLSKAPTRRRSSASMGPCRRRPTTPPTKLPAPVSGCGCCSWHSTMRASMFLPG
jgi:hypothetical protein